ncbi:hypothetical protein WR25_26966 [Diploscapter pachys]|uniref:Mitoguardin n=1 Tax=Diploscapter pachys TaxID=2018661 RepID=A0A2A2JLT5_9BILA|nr:hypothetical protein WR25_26966 [Diploscapter pachys]
MSSGGFSGRLSNRTATLTAAGVGVGVLLLGLFLRRWLRRKTPKRIESSDALSDDISARNRLYTPDMPAGRTPLSRFRGTPSMSDRGSVRNRRTRTQNSVSLPPIEADIVCGVESCQEALRTVEKALASVELVKNRSEKDRLRAETLQSALDRLVQVEKDLAAMVDTDGIGMVNEDTIREEFGTQYGGGSSSWQSYQSPRGAGTLSVLSDDSFMSAFEEFAIPLDDVDIQTVDITFDQMTFLKQGLELAAKGEVAYRKSRTEFCQCESETDFAAKLWCLRQSLEDPTSFYKAYDELVEFLEDESNLELMEEELSQRRVVKLGFWDVVLDFILLDAFEDLKSPPSAIYSVTKNYFLSSSMKYSTISTIIWSMLKAKRQRLQNSNGFIAHFYSISEAVMPAITLGFLGTDGRIGELCQYFRDQITQFVVDIFNPKKVRYTSLDDLAEDVWLVLQNRTEAVQTRLGNELLPPG